MYVVGLPVARYVVRLAQGKLPGIGTIGERAVLIRLRFLVRFQDARLEVALESLSNEYKVLLHRLYFIKS